MLPDQVSADRKRPSASNVDRYALPARRSARPLGSRSALEPKFPATRRPPSAMKPTAVAESSPAPPNVRDHITTGAQLALAQQRPETQNPNAHSAATAHGCPLVFLHTLSAPQASAPEQRSRSGRSGVGVHVPS